MLVIYDKAKTVLVQYKEGNEYGVLRMAICHQRLHQWNEAVACYNVLGAEYAVALYILAYLFDQLSSTRRPFRDRRRSS